MTTLHKLDVPELCDYLIGIATSLPNAIRYQRNADINVWYKEVGEGADRTRGTRSMMLQIAQAFLRPYAVKQGNVDTSISLHYWNQVQRARNYAKAFTDPAATLAGFLGIPLAEAEDHLKHSPLSE